MLKTKKLILSFIFIISGLFCFPSDIKSCNKSEIKVTASTSWTAAFADLAGVDNITVIAPPNLKHPPEYEITVSDVLAVSKSDYFIYAGFERMMETIGNAIGDGKSHNKVKMIKINCDNSIDTVVKNAKIISEIMGTEKESKKRVEKYINCIEKGRQAVEEKGLKGASVLCHKHQVYLAKELGFNVTDVFGPGPVTSKQIASAKKGDYDFIIDNIHNPVGQPLSEVSPDAKYIIWRNFPEKVEHNSLTNVINKNIDSIF